MENTNNTNCCTPDSPENTQTNCCTPDANHNTKGKKIKNTFGLGILGLALILALTTAFKGSDEVKALCNTSENSGGLSKSDFAWLKTDKKVAYIVLKGNDKDQNKKITSKVENLVNELNETEGSAYFLALEKDNSNYQDVVSKLKIERLPSVAVLGKSTLTINGSNVNSTKLIRAYDTVLTSKASCTPQQKATCTGKNNTSYDLKTKVSCTPQQKAACSGSKKTN